ncbi:MAG: CDC48 family AAA ATPase [Candidatus Woesearchaeota archaeon]|jgi:transitional endoplasmic reticulum ATPase|nr:CDC48 family AAA ATPase [Candidatus Woesearchaeota archaeon]
MTEKGLKLKVAEAIQDDVNKGIVRIDSTFMQQMGVRVGDIVEIEGERKTVAIADRAYPGDIGLNIIRMDGIIRRNAKTGIGELIQVKKANVKEAKKIIIAPARKGIVIRASPDLFKHGLLGRSIVKGDIVSLGGTKRRRTTMTESPLFDDIFSVLDENNSMGIGFGFGDIKFVVVETNPKQPVVITEQTEVEFRPEAVEVKEELVPEVTYEDIGGLGDEITKVREMIELPLKHPEIFERLGIEPPKGVLLHGAPGCGKTLLAKAVANETNSHFILINGPEIMSKYYGQSEENIRKKFEDAEKNAPSIIFIDEIDAIASKREETKGEVERRVVAQLLALMDGLQTRGKVVVIAATNVPNILDPALRRPGRFDREIDIGVPNKEGRLNVLKIHTRNMPLSKDVGLKEIADITHGFVGADVSALVKEAAMIVLRRILPELKLKEEESIPNEILEKLRVNHDDFKEALKVVRPSALREVLIETPNVSWTDIGGLENVKQELKEAVEWPLKHPDSFKRLGVRPPKGILLYGAPGSGKTLLAKAVAKESQANFISIKGPELLSKWVGESEKAVREVFKKARQTSPTIIFFDEIDSIAPKRGMSSDSNVTERVVNQLLTEIDGLEEMHDVVIIAATNRPDIMDPGLLRPGRFDRIILTPVPDEKTRLEVFKVHTKGMPLGISKEDIKEFDEEFKNKKISHKTKIISKMAADEAITEEDLNKLKKKESQEITNFKDLSDIDKLLYYLAEKTEGYVGADIEAICREAAIYALRKDINAKEVTIKHFEKALKIVRPSATKEVEEMYKTLQNHFREAKAKQMKEERPSYMG